MGFYGSFFLSFLWKIVKHMHIHFSSSPRSTRISSIVFTKLFQMKFLDHKYSGPTPKTYVSSKNSGIYYISYIGYYYISIYTYIILGKDSFPLIYWKLPSCEFFTTFKNGSRRGRSETSPHVHVCHVQTVRCARSLHVHQLRSSLDWLSSAMYKKKEFEILPPK